MTNRFSTCRKFIIFQLAFGAYPEMHFHFSPLRKALKISAASAANAWNVSATDGLVTVQKESSAKRLNGRRSSSRERAGNWSETDLFGFGLAGISRGVCLQLTKWSAPTPLHFHLPISISAAPGARKLRLIYQDYCLANRVCTEGICVDCRTHNGWCFLIKKICGIGRRTSKQLTTHSSEPRTQDSGLRTWDCN